MVTNIDLEHVDFYRDLEKIKSVFLDFIDRIPFYGLAVLCLDNEPVQDIIPRIRKRFVTYGLSAQADYQARNVEFEGMKSRFEVFQNEKRLGEVNLNLPGMHNVYNSLASIAVGVELDIAFEKIRQALETLEGVQRRLEIKGDAGGVKVIDDYGHHPTEIKTTLDAVRKCWPGRRVVVVFQPHRYTRTRALFNEFTRAFYQSDILRLLPIYSAGEDEIEGVSHEALYDGIKEHGHKDVGFCSGREEMAVEIKALVRPDDIVLTLGAGDVWKVGEVLIRELGL